MNELLNERSMTCRGILEEARMSWGLKYEVKGASFGAPMIKG